MRLLTKADRDNSRQYQFDSLIKNGYQKTEYKNLVIFHHPTDLLLKTFWGTAANHTDFFRYRTAEQMTAKIESLKTTADSREKWKAEQKERNKGYKSNQAAAAAAIKAELKKAFPLVKFSVTSEGFANGDSVHISWTDGPKRDAVENITGKYQYGHFNGMEDIYENTNSRDDIPQAKYVNESRSLSNELEEAVKVELMKIRQYNDEDLKDYRNNPIAEARRLLYITDVPASYTGLTLARNENSRTNDDFYKIVFDVEQTEATQSPAAKVPAGKIQIVDYSEKAFAVIGDTKPIKDKLKSLGGSFNPRLSCGAGWIFSKKRLEDVTKALTEETTETEPGTLETQSPEISYPETVILPTPKTNIFNLEYFKIIWHEGYQNPSYQNITFKTWEEVQAAFVKLWEVNEKGSGGGYTKVKCEMKFLGQEIIINRIDITDKINNGDFNPSQMHIVTYLQSISDEIEPEPTKPQHYETLPEIREAAQGGKIISLHNLSQLVK